VLLAPKETEHVALCTLAIVCVEHALEAATTLILGLVLLAAALVPRRFLGEGKGAECALILVEVDGGNEEAHDDGLLVGVYADEEDLAN